MHILIARNSSNPQANEAALLLQAYCMTENIEVTSLDSQDIGHLDAQVFDMAIALGGDGTVLRVANFARYTGIPILGLNYGSLGFLANPVPDEGPVSMLARALAGELSRELRTNITVDVLCEGDDERVYESALCGDTPAEHRQFFALNELALTRGLSGRIIDIEVFIGDVDVVDMRSDGMVVATATGSTAYALSAGGPLVSPGYNGLIVVPVAPHTLNARAMVTAPNDIVELVLGDNSATREASLFVDGIPMSFDEPIRRVAIKSGAAQTVLLRSHAQEFYERIRSVFFNR